MGLVGLEPRSMEMTSVIYCNTCWFRISQESRAPGLMEKKMERTGELGLN